MARRQTEDTQEEERASGMPFAEFCKLPAPGKNGPVTAHTPRHCMLQTRAQHPSVCAVQTPSSLLGRGVGGAPQGSGPSPEPWPLCRHGRGPYAEA